MSDREAVFQAIRKALAPLEKRTPYPKWEPELTYSQFARFGDSDLDLFQQQLRAAKGLLLESWEEVADFLKNQGATTGYIDSTLVRNAEALKGLDLEQTIDRSRIDDYAFGITPASGAIAESGTVILQDSDCPFRLGALAPWIHIAVVRKQSVFRSVADAVAAMGDDPSIVFVTGPSKTADIEGILIEGVHGPGQQAVLLI